MSDRTVRRQHATADVRAPLPDPLAINHLPDSPIRYVSLDSLRGIAALSVVFFHTTWSTHLTGTTLIRNFYVAVDLFFLLSGFVIAASYRTRVASGPQIASFLQRRVFRVYPLHWAVLSFLVMIELAKLFVQWRLGHPYGTKPAFTGQNSVPILLANLALVQNTGLFSVVSWNIPSWSISTEIIAYIIFAAAGYFGWLRNSWFLVATGCCGLVAYGVLAWTHDSLDLTTDFGIVRCLAGFQIGVGLCIMQAQGRFMFLRRLSTSAASIAELTVVASALLVLGLAHGGLIVLVIPCFIAIIILFQLERGALSRALHARVLQFLGAISFSIYLVNIPIRDLIINAAHYLGAPAHRNALGALLLDISPAIGDGLLSLLIIVTLGVATLTFRHIEEPARLFGRRFSSEPKMHAAPAPRAS